MTGTPIKLAMRLMLMREGWRNLAFVLGMFLAVFSSFALADPWAQGATTTNSTGVSNAPDGHSTYASKAGFIYGVSANVTAQTLQWAAIIGNISGTVQLRGSSNKSVKTWGNTGNIRNDTDVSMWNTVVFAYNSTSLPAWGSLVTNPLSGSSIGSELGITSSLTDSADNTFNRACSDMYVGGANIDCASGGAVYLNHWEGVFTTTPRQAANGTENAYQTVVLDDGTTNMLFTAIARPIQQDLFLYDNATQGHYQMIVWSDNRGDTTATSYDMYVQIA